jgi:two-component system, NtrC family, response regulator PilR
MKNASPPISPEPFASNSLIPHILVVDDEPVLRDLLVRFYSTIGYTAGSVASGEEALTFLQNGNIDLVVTDIQLPGMSGTELIAKMKENFPDVPIMAITGYSDISIAVNVLKTGACDFIIKPFNLDALRESTRIALEKTQASIEMRHLRPFLKESYQFGGMLSRTPEMHQIFEIIRAVAPTEMTRINRGRNGKR